MYVDSNIFIYAALDKETLGNNARAVIKRLQNREIKLAVSPLVFDEVVWIVQKFADRKAANQIGNAMLLLPLTWLDISYSSVKYALTYYQQGLNPRDALHVGTMKDYGIRIIVSEDKDFDKVRDIERWSINKILNI